MSLAQEKLVQMIVTRKFQNSDLTQHCWQPSRQIPLQKMSPFFSVSEPESSLLLHDRQVKHRTWYTCTVSTDTH